jgi:hypothetical protein
MEARLYHPGPPGAAGPARLADGEPPASVVPALQLRVHVEVAHRDHHQIPDPQSISYRSCAARSSRPRPRRPWAQRTPRRRGSGPPPSAGPGHRGPSRSPGRLSRCVEVARAPSRSRPRWDVPPASGTTRLHVLDALLHDLGSDEDRGRGVEPEKPERPPDHPDRGGAAASQSARFIKRKGPPEPGNLVEVFPVPFDEDHTPTPADRVAARPRSGDLDAGGRAGRVHGSDLGRGTRCRRHGALACRPGAGRPDPQGQRVRHDRRGQEAAAP